MCDATFDMDPSEGREDLVRCEHEGKHARTLNGHWIHFSTWMNLLVRWNDHDTGATPASVDLGL